MTAVKSARESEVQKLSIRIVAGFSEVAEGKDFLVAEG
jgi:hypothetical protein